MQLFGACSSAAGWLLKRWITAPVFAVSLAHMQLHDTTKGSELLMDMVLHKFPHQLLVVLMEKWGRKGKAHLDSSMLQSCPIAYNNTLQMPRTSQAMDVL